MDFTDHCNSSVECIIQLYKYHIYFHNFLWLFHIFILGWSH